MTKCPQCGYDESSVKGRVEHNIMNKYISDKTGKPCIINSTEDTITMKTGEVLRREGVAKPVVVPSSKTIGTVVPSK